MTQHDEKILLVDTLIERERRVGAFGHAVRIELLKDIARDLRARAPGVPETTRHVLGEKVAAIARSNRSLAHGLQTSRLIALGQEVVGRWRTIDAALERYAQELPEADREPVAPGDARFG
jgi:hypothetical protein